MYGSGVLELQLVVSEQGKGVEVGIVRCYYCPSGEKGKGGSFDYKAIQGGIVLARSATEESLTRLVSKMDIFPVKEAEKQKRANASERS